jgi:hypothetical protein
VKFFYGIILIIENPTGKFFMSSASRSLYKSTSPSNTQVSSFKGRGDRPLPKNKKPSVVESESDDREGPREQQKPRGGFKKYGPAKATAQKQFPKQMSHKKEVTEARTSEFRALLQKLLSEASDDMKKEYSTFFSSALASLIEETSDEDLGLAMSKYKAELGGCLFSAAKDITISSADSSSGPKKSDLSLLMNGFPSVDDTMSPEEVSIRLLKMDNGDSWRAIAPLLRTRLLKICDIKEETKMSGNVKIMRKLLFFKMNTKATFYLYNIRTSKNKFDTINIVSLKELPEEELSTIINVLPVLNILRLRHLSSHRIIKKQDLVLRDCEMVSISFEIGEEEEEDLNKGKITKEVWKHFGSATIFHVYRFSLDALKLSVLSISDLSPETLQSSISDYLNNTTGKHNVAKEEEVEVEEAAVETVEGENVETVEGENVEGHEDN